MKGINCVLVLALSLVLILFFSFETEEEIIVSEIPALNTLFLNVVGETAWVRLDPSKLADPNDLPSAPYQQPRKLKDSSVYGEILAVENGWLWLQEKPVNENSKGLNFAKHLISLDAIITIGIP
jgi:hypothetical protein